MQMQLHLNQSSGGVIFVIGEVDQLVDIHCTDQHAVIPFMFVVPVITVGKYLIRFKLSVGNVPCIV